ncbi:glycosyltransferase family 4 protein [Roseibium litorale]|uniref:Glycosyltransferase family 4 protein n=1 Tax=Roseibium litorale TaxID=2803841 RepID=A0ABR9CKZ9_9HYPH|nr:glycosyltransferase family 4 protein [Roseibium litorale]MBD8891239.1 glycosyltransferase family 4 protein [Roseibium litorale]
MNLSLTFAYPGDLELRTGGYGYDRRVIQGLRDLGWTVDLLSLGEGFPFPSGETKLEAERRLSALPDDTLVLIDGLAYGVLDDWAAQENARLKIAALVHHPLALETGLEPKQAERFRRSERAALAHSAAVIVTSPMTAKELAANFGVPRDSITIAIPGTDPSAGPRRDRQPDEPLQILSVGTLTRRKGHDVLIKALKLIEDLPWEAKIIGSRTLDPQIAEELDALAAGLGLGGRIDLPGECSDSRLLMAEADIFALASRYEGFGMVFAEALVDGLPIVACSAGAVPDVVPETAGQLVPADDPAAFADALRVLVSDDDARLRYADGANEAGRLLPGWPETARLIADRLETLL